ncbi:MAG: DUF4340 domain-containing protein [Verrucomicrobiota bacterium]|nr:DUF4340 domain-containing protein [Verrucomicrobiota bacterium]
MRLKFTFILLTLNVIAFGVIVYLNHKGQDTKTKSGTLAMHFGRELIDAERIELSGSGLEMPRILERNGSTWQLIEPMKWSANYFAINRILNQLQFLEEEASFLVDEIANTGQSLADYGLENPLLKLTILDNNERISLSVGTLTEIGNNVYLLGPKERKIFVVNRQVIDGLIMDLNDLRTREIFDIPVFEVDALGLQIRSDSSADGSLLKVRLARSNGAWSFEVPVTAKADPALVDNTINALTTAKVERFLEGEDLALKGLESPLMRVTVYGNKRRQTLIIGNLDRLGQGKPEYFAKLEDNPAIFTVMAQPFDALLEAQEGLRERNFMKFDRSKVLAINISGDGQKIRLQKLESSDEDWQVLESKDNEEIRPYRADPKIMMSLLDNLSNLRASSFVVDSPTPKEDASLGFNRPTRTVSLSFTEGETATLILAHPKDDNETLYAKTNQAKFIYQVERQLTLGIIPLESHHYRNRTLDKLPAAARISSLEVTDLFSDQSIINIQLPDDTENWSTYLLEEGYECSSAILEVLNASVNFKVNNYLLDSFIETYEDKLGKKYPWAYRLIATIQLPGGETSRTETREYLFSKRISGTIQIGGSRERDVVFEISQKLIDALYELTDGITLPPEATDQPVNNSPEIEPIAIPQPIPHEGS